MQMTSAMLAWKSWQMWISIGRRSVSEVVMRCRDDRTHVDSNSGRRAIADAADELTGCCCRYSHCARGNGDPHCGRARHRHSDRTRATLVNRLCLALARHADEYRTPKADGVAVDASVANSKSCDECVRCAHYNRGRAQRWAPADADWLKPRAVKRKQSETRRELTSQAKYLMQRR